MFASPHLNDLIERWTSEAASIEERYGDSRLAHLTRTHAKELQEAISRGHSRLVSLSEAGSLCGYSDDHLGKLVRAGILKNYGRKHAPRVRVAELPQKSSHLRDQSSANTHSSRKRIVLAARNGEG